MGLSVREEGDKGVMGKDIFGDAAEEAAGREYGARHADRYARLWKFRRAAGWSLFTGIAGYMVARTYGPAFWAYTYSAVVSGVMYMIGVAVFAIGLWLFVRSVRRRRTRTEYTTYRVSSERLYTPRTYDVDQYVYDDEDRTYPR
jgi:hypothetical protein